MIFSSNMIAIYGIFFLYDQFSLDGPRKADYDYLFPYI